MFNISEATENDIPVIREIADKTWWPAYSSILSAGQIQYMLDTIYAAENMKKDMVSGAQTFLLLRDEGGVRGFASYSIRPEDPAVSKLHKLYVLPTVQAKGYGRALIGEVKRRLLTQNVHKLDLNVNRFNPARHFYEKTGFRVIREEDIPVGPYWMNDYVMRTEF